MGHALELAGERKTVAWRFSALLTAEKKRDSVKGAACRQGGGEWVFRSL